MSHARSAWWRQIELYAPRRTPSRHSIRSTRLSDTTACFRFCCSVSALASPPRILFCLAGGFFFFFFFCWGGGGGGGWSGGGGGGFCLVFSEVTRKNLFEIEKLHKKNSGIKKLCE